MVRCLEASDLIVGGSSVNHVRVVPQYTQLEYTISSLPLVKEHG